MDIKQLIEIVKKKIESDINLEKILIEDKTFLHKNHVSHTPDKYHLKITIKSKYLEKKNKLESHRQIHNILKNEIKKYIHSLQLNIN